MNYLWKYINIGAAVGLTVFTGNLLSVCIPGNTWVHTKYVWENMNLSKVCDCLVISTTKSLVAAVTWPSLILRAIQDIIYNRYEIGAFMCIGYVHSPHNIKKSDHCLLT